MTAAIDRLLANKRERTIAEGPHSSFDFTNTKNPEGAVWYCDGALTIKSDSGTVNFTGKGTIIVNGKITVESNIVPYGDNTGYVLGLVAKDNNIEIKSEVTKIQGVVFYASKKDDASGKIEIK